MKVIKRDGREVDFDRNKIISAIGKANSESLQNHEKTLSDDEIKNIAIRIYDKLRRSKRIYSVEDIQDLIEEYIDKYGCFPLAKRYTLYRYKQSLIRKKNTTDDAILSLIDLSNENIKQENSNKNPTIIPTQRDYMAGEVSKDLTDRVYFLKILLRLTEKELFISTIKITLHNILIIVAYVILMICSRTERLSVAL